MRTVFSAVDEPVRTRMDYWRYVMGEVMGPADLRAPDDPDFRDRLVLGGLGAVQVAEVSVTGPGRADRTARHVRLRDPGLYKVDVQVSGRSIIEQRNHQAALQPGDLTLVDLSRPGRWAAGPARVVTVAFPRGLVPLPERDLAELAGRRIPGDDGLASLTSSFARELPAQLDACDAASGSRLGAVVLDLLTTTLAARLDRARELPASTRQRTLLLQVRAFIERHLCDPTLTPAGIAAAHHISLRYLHKLFEPERTTVAAWVRHRRLERCRRDLLDATRRAEPVSVVAARWGFVDPAHFSRLFRAAYGVAPTHYREIGLGADPA